MLLLPTIALLLQASTAPDSTQRRRRTQSGICARRPARGQRSRRSVDRVEDRTVDAVDVGAGVGSRAGVERRRIGDRVLVRPLGKLRSLARRGRSERRRRAGALDHVATSRRTAVRRVATDASIFVRGRLGAAALWVRLPNGAESRLTKDRAAEQWPAISPDGSRLAYVSIADGTRKLHARNARHGARHRRAHRRSHRAAGLVAERRSFELDGVRRARSGVRDAARRPLREPRQRAPRRVGVESRRKDDRAGRHRAGSRSRRSATTAIPIELAIATPISWRAPAAGSGRSTRRRCRTSSSPNSRVERRRSNERATTPTRSINSGIARRRSTTPRPTRRRGARSGRR